MTKPIFEVIPGGKDATTAAIPTSKKLYAVVLSSDPHMYRTLPDGTVTQVPAFTAPEFSDPRHPALIYADNENEAKSLYVKFIAEYVGEEDAALITQRLADIIVLGEVTGAKTTAQPGLTDCEVTIVQKVKVMGEQFVNDPSSGELLD